MKEKNQNNTDSLEKALINLSKPQITASSKIRIKNSVFASIKREDNIVSFIKNSALNVHLNSIRKSFVKEKVFAVIENADQKNYFFRRFFLFNKKLISSALVLFMSFTMFSFITVDTRVVRAQTLTTLRYFEGNVNVIREGKVLEAYINMELTEHDKIVTGRMAEAEIEYFDDSVSRLSSNTALTINRLLKGDENAVKSYVEISVDEGSVWSKVINIVDESSYFSVKANDISTKTKKAAFNVKNQQDEVKIEVFNHAVEIETSVLESEKIVGGQKVSMSSDNVFKVEKLDIAESDKNWVENNLREDLAHIEEIENRDVAQKKELLKESSISGDALLLITFNDVKEKQLELDIAEKNFIAAEIELRNHELTTREKEKIKKDLDKFLKKIDDYYIFVDEIAESDSEYAEELILYAEEKVLARKKDLSVVLPDSPVYLAKEVIDDIQLSIVESNSDLVEKKLEKALDKLADAESLAQKGDNDLAVTIINNTEKDLDAAKEIANYEGEENDPEIDAMVEEAYNVKESLSEKLLADKERESSNENLQPEPIVTDDTITVVDDGEQNDNTDINTGVISDTQVKYGVEIVGDKPLSPLLNDF